MATTTGNVKRTRFGQWNVRTLYQAGKFDQLEAECERLKLDVVGVSEVRWNGSGEFRSKKGNLLIYSGMPHDDDPHIRGVAIFLNKRMRNALISWNATSERIITARLRSGKRNLSLVQCYAPTEDSEQNTKEEFYSLLNSVLGNLPSTDIVILMGDFNARIGADNTGYEQIMGKHGIGQCNVNGDLLIETCINNDLKIGGSVFPHKNNHKVSWKNPAGHADTQIDHICVSRKWFYVVHDVRNKRSAEIGSDHYLIIVELYLKLLPKRSMNTSSRPLDIDKLKSADNLANFQARIRNLDPVWDNTLDSDASWTRFRAQLHTICEDTLGYRSNQEKEWLSDATWKIIEERRLVKEKFLAENDPLKKAEYDMRYSVISKEIKTCVRKDRENFYNEMSSSAQLAADRGDIKQLFKITKNIVGKRENCTAPIENEEGVQVTDKKEQLEIWRRHFERTLNIIPSGPMEEITIRRRSNPNRSITTDPPSTTEIRNAIIMLKPGKAAGSDGIPPECFKAEPDAFSRLLEPLFRRVWEEEIIPGEWKQSIIIKIPKKGDRRKCGNWRGISLLSSVMKIFNNVILNRIAEPLDRQISRTQVGFRPNRSCVDHINTMRILIEQSAEFNAPLYMTFIDFEKAFDAVNREFVWKSLSARGIPGKIVNVLRKSYEGASNRVLHDGALSETFQSMSGVKQGCGLSPILFITALDTIFESSNQQHLGINWKLNEKLGDLAYADDIVLLSNRHSEIQQKLTLIADEARKAGLSINIAKTKVMRMNSTNNTPLFINNIPLEEVEKFEYLGSMLTNDGGAKKDVDNRIRKARVSFAILNRIWKTRNLVLRTKINIFNACVKSVLLYGCETWHVTNAITTRIQTFINRCLRRILGIWWPRTISNEQLWRITEQNTIEKDILKRKYGWIGHTLRKPSSEIAHAAYEWNPQGSRTSGRPKTTWRRTVQKETTKSFNELRSLARRRDAWKNFVKIICE